MMLLAGSMRGQFPFFRNRSQEPFRVNGIALFLEFRKNAEMANIQWILEGLSKPGKSKKGLASALRRSPQVVTAILQDKRRITVDEIPKIEHYLEVVAPIGAGIVNIVGIAGQNPDGSVSCMTEDQYGEAPMPLGGSKDTVAIEVTGDSLQGVAKDGTLLYYETPVHSPTEEMHGELCVVGLEDGRTLLKYLHPGRGPGLYDLESASAPTLRDAPVKWAALVTTIIPGPQAKKLRGKE